MATEVLLFASILNEEVGNSSKVYIPGIAEYMCIIVLDIQCYRRKEIPFLMFVNKKK